MYLPILLTFTFKNSSSYSILIIAVRYLFHEMFAQNMFSNGPKMLKMYKKTKKNVSLYLWLYISFISNSLMVFFATHPIL